MTNKEEIEREAEKYRITKSRNIPKEIQLWNKDQEYVLNLDKFLTDFTLQKLKERDEKIESLTQQLEEREKVIEEVITVLKWSSECLDNYLDGLEPSTSEEETKDKIEQLLSTLTPKEQPKT